jgi:cytochrome b6-f complex iron-sulfur subunit
MTADARKSEGASGRQMPRREFFFTGCFALVTATVGFMASTFRYLVPNVLYEPSRRFTIGLPDEFPQGTATFLPDRRLFVFNSPDGFYAISAICTHLGCTVRQGGPGFACPCHGSEYDKNGNVVQGPAPKSLAWYAMSLTPRGQLLVDLDHVVQPDFRLRA